jgi:cysteine desulfurase
MTGKKKKPSTAEKKNTKEIYFDNNSMTRPSSTALSTAKSISKWVCNPSADNPRSKRTADEIENVRSIILEHIGDISRKSEKTVSEYTVIWCSCGSEANSMIITSAARSYLSATKQIPHIIVSAVEHTATLAAAQSLVDAGEADVTVVAPNIDGCITVSAVSAAIKPNTCLISIMAANNESGAMNPVHKIAEIAKSHSIPFHSDAVQVFGKYKLNLKSLGIDAITIAFQKMHALPGGLGALIIKKSLIINYKISPIIFGEQQDGLRGGTLNAIGIIAAGAAFRDVFINRDAKNKHLLNMKTTIINKLKQHFKFSTLQAYIARNEYASALVNQRSSSSLLLALNNRGVSPLTPPDDVELVVIGPPPDSDKSLPNTLLIAIAWNTGIFCNVKLKKALAERLVVVSVGSACHTSSSSASHVLVAMRVPPVLKRGVIRISLADDNTLAECDKFVKIFTECINLQISKK